MSRSMLDGRGLIRPVLLALVTMLFGLAMGMTSRPAATDAATTSTRAWSCQGRSFVPWADSQPFNTSLGGGRTGYGYFQCNADIPNKAVVTRVRFTLRDSVAGHGISECSLYRTSLVASSAGALNTLASVPGTAGSPGNVRLADTSISNATIDRLNYDYYLSCLIEAADNDLVIYGADVTYQITAANG